MRSRMSWRETERVRETETETVRETSKETRKQVERVMHRKTLLKRKRQWWERNRAKVDRQRQR